MNKQLFKILINDLKQSKTAEDFTIQYELNEKEFAQLRDALSVNTSVKTLTFTAPVGDRGASYIAEALMANTSVTKVVLSNTHIFNAGVDYLAQALLVNSTLTTLELANNHIDHKGMQPLAKALEVNKSLTALNLSGNSIGNRSAREITAALAKNDHLNNLNLSSNPIKKAAAFNLLNTLSSKQDMPKMDLNLDKIKLSKKKVNDSMMLGNANSNLNLNISSNAIQAIDIFAVGMLGFIVTAYSGGLVPIAYGCYKGGKAAHDHLAYKEFSHRQLQKPNVPAGVVTNVTIASKPSNASSTFFNENNQHLPKQQEPVVEVKELVKPERKSSTQSLP